MLAPAPAPRIIAPAPSQQNRVAPTASTSQLQQRHTPVVQRQVTPDIEVDVVSPESDGQEEATAAFQAERDPQSEEIVKQLEKGLPKWPGFGEEGWMNEINPVRLNFYRRQICCNGLQERYSDIVHTIKSFKDVMYVYCHDSHFYSSERHSSGNRLAVCLESLPEESSPTLNLSSTAPISFKQIEASMVSINTAYAYIYIVSQTRARHKMYKSSKEFDFEFARLFEKARRWHEPGSEAYSRALLLQVMCF